MDISLGSGPKDPQEFFPASEVKCMLFPSMVKAKPILSLQMYQGDLFEMIDSAAGFVMQHRPMPAP